MVRKTIKVPPDGGYGWVIIFASALCNFIIIPLMQSFGLIFKDTFATMGLSAAQGSLIINLNAAFGMMMGLVNGALIKSYGPRKCGFVASTFTTVGIVLTSFATTFEHFIVTYGIITSLGMGLNMAVYGYTVNLYFRKNRAKAAGWAQTITGLGPILMPQIITLLGKFHTVQGVTLILGGLAAHSFLSALLLRPVKWYMKTEIVDEEENGEKKLEPIAEDDTSQPEPEGNGEAFAKARLLERSISVQPDRPSERERHDTAWSIDPEIENAGIYGMDSALGGSVISLSSIINPGLTRRFSTVSQNWKKSAMSLEERRPSLHQVNNQPDLDPADLTGKKKKSWLKRLFLHLAKVFDLDLLKDPVYVNIMLGMSLAIFAELNFSILTAFILADFGLVTDEIATFLSVLGIVDIVLRFLAPYIGEYLNEPPRPMYLLSLILLMLSRFSLLLSTDYHVLLVIAVGLGFAKGIRTVYMTLVIPTYVPIEKLPSASGLQMMVNGLCIIIGGPIIGLVRDLTGSYTWCIVIMNCVTCTTIVMWLIEWAIVNRCRCTRNRKGAKQDIT